MLRNFFLKFLKKLLQDQEDRLDTHQDLINKDKIITNKAVDRMDSIWAEDDYLIKTYFFHFIYLQ